MRDEEQNGAQRDPEVDTPPIAMRGEPCVEGVEAGKDMVLHERYGELDGVSGFGEKCGDGCGSAVVGRRDG